MKVEMLLNHFKDHRKPRVAAAACLGIHPATIRRWEETGGDVPEQWVALFKEKTKEES